MDTAVPPVRIGECSTCPWEALCLGEMEAVDHVSLIPRSTFDHYAVHRARGITTRAQVALLDWPTAYAMHGPEPRSSSVDLVALRELTASLPPTMPISDVLRPVARVVPAGTDVGTVAVGTNGSVPGDSVVQLRLLELDPEVPEPETAPEPVDLDETLGIDPTEMDIDARHLVPVERVDDIVARFAGLGVHTVADLADLDPFTASYSGQPCGHLPSVIDAARAAVSGRAYLARGLDRPEVPRADVEIDVDMENVEEGVYLWGTCASGSDADLDRIGIRPGYRAFWDLQPMTAAIQAEVFGRFWNWMSEIRTACEAAGLSFRAYCYTSAEHQKMVQIISAAPEGTSVPLPTRAEVDRFVRSSQWVDVYEVVRSSLVVGHGLGLKKVAPLAGFRWRDDDAGGLQSMTWHHEAMNNPDPVLQASNRARLLAYNEDDVRATLAVRDWLESADIPPIETWVPPGSLR